ncbi:MAG: alpha/beta hydrolase [Spirochaetales bacterium]|nr:alpha/beta hydrolase [Spirochaetales bacterium]
MKRLILILILTLLIIIPAGLRLFYHIEEKSLDGDFFYTETEGTRMPVWVCGNPDSKTFILYLAGGPGDSCLLQHFHIPMTKLEQKYRVVYYDQRGAGRSRGGANAEKITLKQFVRDTDHIVDLINHKYNNPDIILMGHSWGGALGTAYLLDDERQNKIKAWIEIDGGHNWIGMEKSSRQYAMEYASKHTDEKKWRKALEWYKENPVINSENIVKHALYLNAAHAYTPKESAAENPYTISSLRMLFSYRTNVINSNFRTWKLARMMDTFSIDLSSEMHNIKIPTLILWGEKDYRIPVEFAMEAYKNIGAQEKKLVILPSSGHSPSVTDFPLYISSIDNFISQN